MNSSACAVDGCERVPVGRGWCNAHWRRWRRYGDPGPAKIQTRVPKGARGGCSVADCTRVSVVNEPEQMCGAHYNRWKRHGNVTVAPKLAVVPEGKRLIQADVTSRDRSACWPWDGKFSVKGYAMLSNFKVMYLSLEADGRPRPPAPGNLALHSCDQKWCWNPAHLRWGTQTDNARDYAERWGFCPHCAHCRPTQR